MEKYISHYYKTFNEFDMKMHLHNSYEIMYVTNGTCIISMENKSLTLKKSDLIFLDKNSVHCLKTKKAKILCIEFITDDKEISKLFNVSNYNIYRNELDTIPYLLGIISELNNDFKHKKEMIHMLTKQIIISLQRKHHEKSVLTTDSQYIAKTIHFLENNYGNKIRLDEISKIVGLEKSYICRLFKSHTGINIMEYLKNIRIEKACQLLNKTNLSISFISEFVGFSTLQYFSSCFKRKKGLTPYEYKMKTKSPSIL